MTLHSHMWYALILITWVETLFQFTETERKMFTSYCLQIWTWKILYLSISFIKHTHLIFYHFFKFIPFDSLTSLKHFSPYLESSISWQPNEHRNWALSKAAQLIHSKLIINFIATSPLHDSTVQTETSLPLDAEPSDGIIPIPGIAFSEPLAVQKLIFNCAAELPEKRLTRRGRKVGSFRVFISHMYL